MLYFATMQSYALAGNSVVGDKFNAHFQKLSEFEKKELTKIVLKTVEKRLYKRVFEMLSSEKKEEISKFIQNPQISSRQIEEFIKREVPQTGYIFQEVLSSVITDIETRLKNS